jgi:hypothetical protein
MVVNPFFIKKSPVSKLRSPYSCASVYVKTVLQMQQILLYDADSNSLAYRAVMAAVCQWSHNHCQRRGKRVTGFWQFVQN